MNSSSKRILPSDRPGLEDLLPALPGYEHIARYWDPTRDCFAAKLLPGEFYVSTKAELITTVLGSCVSACIRDRVQGIGGMNHFMLPESANVGNWGGFSTAARYGSYAMETLINEVLKHGGKRQHLEVKLFGGGRVMQGMTDIGRRNIEFARQYLANEGLEVVGEDLGGFHPRKVVFYPDSGRAQVKALRVLHNKVIINRETDYMASLNENPPRGEVELF